MKKLLILLIILMLLVSCQKVSNIIPAISTNNPDNPKPSITTSTNNIEEVDSLTIIYPVMTNKAEKLEISTWEQYFSETHNINIHVEFINYKGPKFAFENDLEGILYLTNGNLFIYSQYINLIINKYDVYSMNEYFEEYNWIQHIDEKYIIPVTLNDEIKAVPCLSNAVTFPRYYNKEYLTLLDVEVPTTINEFTEFLEGAYRIDDSFYPSYINLMAISENTSDIFRGFGAYIGAQEESAITFNPITGSIEDGVFSAGFESGLLYIRMLQEADLLKTYMGEEPAVNLTLATEFKRNIFYNALLRKEEPSYEFEKGYYLEGSNNEYLVPSYRSISYYVFLKTISNLDGVALLFNQLMTNGNYSYDLHYGLEGVDYSITDNSNARDNVLLQVNQIIPNENPTIFEVESYDAIIHLPESLSYELNSSMDLFNLSGIMSSENSEKIRGFFHVGAPQSLINLFNDENSVSDNIEAYKNEFTKYQIGNIINQMNDYLGFKTIYDYPSN